MSMGRNIITINESGNIVMPENTACIWMSEPELVGLFGVIAPTHVRLENGYNADIFSFPMIVALAFRIDSFGAEQVRNTILKRLYLRKEKTSIFFSLGNNGTKVFNYQA